jgi:S-formylglutathione hydrolase FrmB
MGGRGALRLTMKYPQLFCSLFCQAGNVPRTLAGYDPGKPNEYPNNYLGPEQANFADNDAFELLKKNRDQIAQLRIQIACGTQDREHIVTIRDFHQALLDVDIDHTYIEYEELKHQRTLMIERYQKTWFDYHVESMRRAAILAATLSTETGK